MASTNDVEPMSQSRTHAIDGQNGFVIVCAGGPELATPSPFFDHNLILNVLLIVYDGVVCVVCIDVGVR